MRTGPDIKVIILKTVTFFKDILNTGPDLKYILNTGPDLKDICIKDSTRSIGYIKTRADL